MSIKNVRPTKKSGFNQGYYIPNDPTKYVGPTPIIYRSSWERKFMMWCDNNDKVMLWSSEPVQIEYISRADNKKHIYYPDFYMKVLQEDNNLKEFLVEIKPKQQLIKPEPPKKASKKALSSYQFLAEQYIKNLDKYTFAKEYCKNRNWNFIVLTEDSINGLR
jgi:hypothetical protein